MITREFDAPIDLVFDVFTKPEHVRKTFAPFGEQVTVCSIDLRVGGSYHFVMVTDDDIECSFRGTYFEVDRPNRTVATWAFEGWPGVEAIETIELRTNGVVTNLTWRLLFRDQADRSYMSTIDGIVSNLDIVEDHLRALLDLKETVPD